MFLLRIPRLPLALRLRLPEGVFSISDKSKLAGALAGAGVGGGGVGVDEFPNKHMDCLFL